MGAPAAGLHLKLPVSPTKFCAPMPGLEAAPFFERWNGAGGPPNEAQQITTLKERPQNMALFSELSAKGLHLANLAVRGAVLPLRARARARRPRALAVPRRPRAH